jgi:hypothetical protein
MAVKFYSNSLGNSVQLPKKISRKLRRMHDIGELANHAFQIYSDMVYYLSARASVERDKESELVRENGLSITTPSFDIAELEGEYNLIMERAGKYTNEEFPNEVLEQLRDMHNKLVKKLAEESAETGGE